MTLQKSGCTFLVLGVFLGCVATADETQQQDVDALIREGIAMHDQQRYSDAIALYEQALALDPQNAFAGYEMAFAYQVSGDLAGCIESANKTLERGNASGASDYYISGLYVVLGSCHSASGDGEQALQVFRDGLQRYPDNYDLHFNIAITLGNSGDLENAQQHLVTAMTLDPAHPSPYYMLGEVLGKQGYRPSAMLAYIAFLQKEFNTERSSRAAIALVNSMYAPKADDEAPVITVSVKEELTRGFTGLQMAYYTAKIRRSDNDEIIQPLGENITSALNVFLRMASAVTFDVDDSGFVATHLLPMVDRIAEAGSAESFAWFVVATAQIPGGREWVDAHSTEVDQLANLLKSGNDTVQ